MRPPTIFYQLALATIVVSVFHKRTKVLIKFTGVDLDSMQRAQVIPHFD